MLQRVQTVYMLASVVAVLMMHFFWLAAFTMPEATVELNSLGLVCATEGFEVDHMAWDLTLLLGAMLALPLVNIFLYKHRSIQLRVLIYAAIIHVGYYALFFYDCAQYRDLVATAVGVPAVEVTYNYIMLAMPALSLFCLIMAMRGVLYDIALIKSLERLR